MTRRTGKADAKDGAHNRVARQGTCSVESVRIHKVALVWSALVAFMPTFQCSVLFLLFLYPPRLYPLLYSLSLPSSPLVCLCPGAPQRSPCARPSPAPPELGSSLSSILLLPCSLLPRHNVPRPYSGTCARLANVPSREHRLRLTITPKNSPTSAAPKTTVARIGTIQWICAGEVHANQKRPALSGSAVVQAC